MCVGGKGEKGIRWGGEFVSGREVFVLILVSC